MKKLTKETKNELFQIYDDYAHSRIDRRDFISKLSKYAIGGITVASLMSFLSPDYQKSKKLSENDPRIHTEFIEYDSPNGAGLMKGLFCKPKNQEGKLPAVLVVHENRGLNPYIEDVVRQLALDGFMALGPDALTPFGGYPGTDDEGRTMQAQRNRDEMLEDFISGFHWLQGREESNGNIGVVGFCFGGWIANMMACKIPDLKASVPYYGSQASIELVPQIKAKLQLHYAEFDARVNAGWPDYEKALQENGIDYEMHYYPEANHGFHNHSTPRYDEAAASLAWERTIDFFNKHLG